MYARKLSFVALMAVVISVCSWITIPFTVPFTMQTFAVFCAVLILGGKYGTMSIGLYILLGAVGLPVFSGFAGGIGHILGPTGGYILGFLFIGFLFTLCEPYIRGKKVLVFICLLMGLFVCYLIGTLWFAQVKSAGGEELSLLSIIAVCVLPYIIPDVLKLLLAMFIYGRIRGAMLRMEVFEMPTEK